MGNRSQREILIENQIYLAGLDKDGFQVGLFTGIHGPARIPRLGPGRRFWSGPGS